MAQDQHNRTQTVPLVTRVTPEATLSGPGAETMNFLNEVISRYPKAISFAAGRPPNGFVPTAYAPRWLEGFIAHHAETTGKSLEAARVFVGQYSDTGGIIQDLIARYLAVEENVRLTSRQIMVANGFQEALLVHLTRLARWGGAIVALDPTYVGLTGGAMAAGVPLYAATRGDDAIAAIAAGIKAARDGGHGTVAVYVIPDFDNPSGARLTRTDRQALLALAEREDVMILEDAAYRAFDYSGERLPSLLTLDTRGSVIHLGTFSKMFLPGVRIGFAATRSADVRLITETLAIKSFTTVATAPIAQAIVGGFLLDVDFAVTRANGPRAAFCQANRDAIVAALDVHLSHLAAVRWTVPEGGFFIVVELPFTVAGDDATSLARDHGVIITPMAFFSPSGACQNQVRFAFSNVTPDAIAEGIERFARYVVARIEADARSA